VRGPPASAELADARFDIWTWSIAPHPVHLVACGSIETPADPG
jgi:hypothetical protein